MALNQNQWGNETADDLRAWANSVVPQNRTTFITDDELRQAWRIIENRAVIRLRADMDIVLDGGDITNDDGTYKTAAPDNKDVEGISHNLAVTLSQKVD